MLDLIFILDGGKFAMLTIAILNFCVGVLGLGFGLCHLGWGVHVSGTLSGIGSDRFFTLHDVGLVKYTEKFS